MDKRWDEIETTVRNRIPEYSNDVLATERQWAKRGYIAISDSDGRKLWTNQNCGKSCLYLFDSEVRKMSEEEIDELKKAERKRKYEQARARKISRDRRNEEIMLELKNLRLDNRIMRMHHEEEVERVAEKARRALKKLTNKLCKAVPRGDQDIEYIVLDTETTGLEEDTDEILQLSIIDNNNNVLLNEYYKPMFVECWDDAESIHGISHEMVQDKNHMYEVATEIQEVINRTSKIVCYNARFDLSFLEALGIDLSHIEHIDDVMIDFARIYGEWSDWWGDYKWQKLTTCADYYDYDWSNTEAHNSLADCLATNWCYRKMSGTIK